MLGQWPWVLGSCLLIHLFPTFKQPERGHVLEGVPSDIDFQWVNSMRHKMYQYHPDVQILI